MDIKTVREARVKYEQLIAQEVHKLLVEFENETGMCPQSVGITMIDDTTMDYHAKTGGGHHMVVVNSKIELEI